MGVIEVVQYTDPADLPPAPEHGSNAPAVNPVPEESPVSDGVILIASINLGPNPTDRGRNKVNDLTKLSNMGVTVIACQEGADQDKNIATFIKEHPGWHDLDGNNKRWEAYSLFG